MMAERLMAKKKFTAREPVCVDPEMLVASGLKLFIAQFHPFTMLSFEYIPLLRTTRLSRR